MATCVNARAWASLALACGFLGLTASAADETAKKAGSLIIIDSAGKEQKITAWKLAAGTRHLSWLATAGEKPAAEKKGPPVKGAKPKPQVGPEALEFREEHSTDFEDGIITLIPTERLRSIDYDLEKKAVTIHLATSDKMDDDQILTGTTKFKGVNRLTIDAEVDKGDMGIAEVKYLGGAPQGGIRAVRFPSPKAGGAATPGRSATVTVAEKGKSVQKVVDLQPLYRMPDGSERIVPTLMFKKTLKIDLAKVQKIHQVEKSKPGDETQWVLTMKDGETQTLSPLPTLTIDDKQAVLEGLVGKVPAGYKIFPAHTFTDIQFEEEKKE